MVSSSKPTSSVNDDNEGAGSKTSKPQSAGTRVQLTSIPSNDDTLFEANRDRRRKRIALKQMLRNVGEAIGNVSRAPAEKTEEMMTRVITRFLTSMAIRRMSRALDEGLSYGPNKWDEFLNRLERDGNDETVVWFSQTVLRRLVVKSPITTFYCLICTVIYLLHITFIRGLSNFLALPLDFYWSSPFSYLVVGTHLFAHESIVQLRTNLMYIMFLGPIAESSIGPIGFFQVMSAVAVGTSISFMMIGRVPQLGGSGISTAIILLYAYLIFQEETKLNRFFIVRNMLPTGGYHINNSEDASSTTPSKNPNTIKGDIPTAMIVIVSLWFMEEIWNMFCGNDGISHLIGGILGAYTGYMIHERKFGAASHKSRRRSSTGHGRKKMQ